jgi:hypothetical protein
VVVSVAVLTISFFLHWKWCGSMMQLSEDAFGNLLRKHLFEYPFSMRYFTSYAILLLGNTIGLSVKTSFFAVQFIIAFLLGLAFDRYLAALKLREPIRGTGVFLLLTSYPILAAFIEPVHTWDDMWTYLFLTLTLSCLVRSRAVVGLVWFTLACLAREQSLIFLPVILYCLLGGDRPKRWGRAIALAGVAVGVLGLFYWWHWQPSPPQRFALFAFNFANPLRASDTVFSLFVSFGWVWTASAMALLHRDRTETRWMLVWGAAVTVPATLVLALFLTNARETRILFPPFLFLLPLALEEINSIHGRLAGRFSFGTSALQLAIVAALMTLGVAIGHVTFPAFEYRQCPDFQRLWAGLDVGLSLSLIYWSLCKTRVPSRPRPL